MCVASISHLGFLATMWMLNPSLLHPFVQDPSITDLACIGPVLYQPTDVESSGPFHGDPSSLSGRTHEVMVQGSRDDGSKACRSTVSIRIP